MMSDAMAQKTTWGRLRLAGVIGGVLVLVLVAVMVLINVFSGPAIVQQGSGSGGVDARQVPANLDELGMLVPPVTEDPFAFGPLAAAALLTYDTREASFSQAKEGIRAWMMNFDTEENFFATENNADDAIYWSDFPAEDAYRGQSELGVSVVAAVVGESKEGADHRDISEEEATLFVSMDGYYVVTSDLELTYEFTAEEGDRRTYVERVTVSVEMNCGQNGAGTRPTTNCVVRGFTREFRI